MEPDIPRRRAGRDGVRTRLDGPVSFGPDRESALGYGELDVPRLARTELDSLPSRFGGSFADGGEVT
jgi:hypothetical protein